MPIKTLDTVNVVEIADTTDMSVSQIISFPDTPEGNVDAEILFARIVKENFEMVADGAMEDHIENGYFSENNFWVGIVHSNPIADD